jgi:hypothetical protein
MGSKTSGKRPKTITFKTNENGCHICTSHKKGDVGYPVRSIKSVPIRLHRYIYELNYGKIENGFLIMHVCDNKMCINPKHLIKGTNKDNMLDCYKKRRHCFGEKRPGAKLTNKKVKMIRRILEQNFMTGEEIAKLFDISSPHLSYIKTGKYWKWVK